MIARTTHRVCGCLRKTIDGVVRILGEIAGGSLAVDVMANESYYIGDFKALFASLQSIHANLMKVIRDISQVASQVDTSAGQVSPGAQALSQGTIEQATSIQELLSNVTGITSQLQSSTVRCGSASELVDKATGYTAGKGFSVVADEVRNLAAKSEDAVQSTNLLLTAPSGT